MFDPILWSKINKKSDIASPTFTGIPAVPTATPRDNSTQIANTAFIKGEIDYALTTVALGLKVDKTTEIAGEAIGTGISKTDLLTALNVADGAEVNVNPDWNATSGEDGFIKNKPDISTKQDKLIAGDNITIESNIISASGGTGGVSVANAVTVEASNFSNLLSTNATNVQKALDELDQAVKNIDGVDILNLFS